MRARTSIFCSSACYHGSTKGVPKVIRTPKKCLICGKEFINVKTPKAKYCSKECYMTYFKSPEHRAIIHESQIGRKMPDHVKSALIAVSRTRVKSPEEKRKIAAAHTGPKNSNWRGGTSSRNGKMIRRICGMATWSKKILARDDRTCQLCGIRNTGRKKMHAHHILPYADYPENRLDLENGVTLCKHCHRHYAHRPIKNPEEAAMIGDFPLDFQQAL